MVRNPLFCASEASQLMDEFTQRERRDHVEHFRCSLTLSGQVYVGDPNSINEYGYIRAIVL